MFGLPLAFGAPAVLAGLIVLPVIWWLLRLTPPRPKSEVFPPLRILARVVKAEETPSKSPWWLTLLRLLIAALVIVALADPVLNPRESVISGDGPLVIVMDNGWATAPDWDDRVEAAGLLLDDAEAAGLPVSLVFTAENDNDATPAGVSTARERLRAAKPRPLHPDRARAATALTAALDGVRPGTLAFLSDGIGRNDQTAISALMETQPATFRLIEGDLAQAVALTAADNDASNFAVTATRLDTSAAQTVPISAHDIRGRPIASGSIDFAAGAATGEGVIEAPFELRNDFARIRVDAVSSAGATYLLDDSFRRRRVALISGEALDMAQPLLSPLFYIKRALDPFADLIEPRETDLARAIPEMIAERPSVIVMADIGTVPDEAYEPIANWINGGGTLLRFAGPRLAGAAADDPLVPVRLRQGERALGGSLSWTEPQPLADFPPDSPFAGMARPEGITVTRQVLAEPSPDLQRRTWANLADGTPLVTTREIGDGRIVLFHITAEATWSNLPITGEFVEMLRRTIQLSRTIPSAERTAAGGQSLPPYRLLDADGALVQPAGQARPLVISAGTQPLPTFDNPPGLYGSEDGFRALNLMAPGEEIAALELPEAGGIPVERASLIRPPAVSLQPWLFATALILLLIDSLIVLALAGALARPRIRGRAATASGILLAAVMATAAFVVAMPPASAADEQPGDTEILSHLDATHIAYVVTGDKTVDETSELGLAGLSRFMSNRTALEPEGPVGVDIETDQLAFYPLIYWPMSADAPMPSNAAISRIDAYMKSGGTVLFDTRDQLSSLESSGATSPETQRLRVILANLDIPPLEPVPPDHVLTKAFYLLDDFPGRYRGGSLWVEALPEDGDDRTRPARAGDGVSSIIITGNDLAGAWAVDSNNIPIYPTVPADPMQREHAYRTGVNIMMYMLTGNYKADQVHIPALLERLGQ